MNAHDGLADDGLSRAGLANESSDFSRKNAKAGTPDGIDGAAHQRKRNPQIFNTEQICACAHAKGFLAVSLLLRCDNCSGGLKSTLSQGLLSVYASETSNCLANSKPASEIGRLA
ncbi:hypothetical protein D3C86_1557250 [compost metagenome]